LENKTGIFGLGKKIFGQILSPPPKKKCFVSYVYEQECRLPETQPFDPGSRRIEEQRIVLAYPDIMCLACSGFSKNKWPNND